MSDKEKGKGRDGRVFICINGILNLPSDSRGWNDRAVTWIQTRTQASAEKFEYFSLALTRSLFQKRHAEDLLEVLRAYGKAASENRLIIVAHSNGADLAIRALEDFQLPVAELHLFSAACEADVHLNGLAHRFAEQTLGRLCVYVAGRDRAMPLAQLSKTLLSWLRLGYGTMGKDGAINVPLYAADRVRQRTEKDFGHSDWFKPAHFEQTMQWIVGKSD